MKCYQQHKQILHNQCDSHYRHMHYMTSAHLQADQARFSLREMDVSVLCCEDKVREKMVTKHAPTLSRNTYRSANVNIVV